MAHSSAEEGGPRISPNIKYELKHEISEGTNPGLHRAKELGTGRTLVVKIFNESGERNKDELLKHDMESEIKMLKLVQGRPHIIVTGNARYSQHPTLRIELPMTAYQGSLADLIIKDGFAQPLLAQHTIIAPLYYYTVLAQMLAALTHVHGAGIIHRDIQPENILYDKDARFFLAGFGNADHAIPPPRGGLQRLTSPQHMSPEILDSQLVSAATDIWSLGVVCLSMLDLPPWDPPNPSDPKEKVGTVWCKLMPRIAALIERPEIEMMIRINPHERPTVFELIYHLGDTLTDRLTRWQANEDLHSLVVDFKTGKALEMSQIPILSSPEPDFLLSSAQAVLARAASGKASSRGLVLPKRFIGMGPIQGPRARPLPFRPPRVLRRSSLAIRPPPKRPKGVAGLSSMVAKPPAQLLTGSQGKIGPSGREISPWVSDSQIMGRTSKVEDALPPLDCLSIEDSSRPVITSPLQPTKSEDKPGLSSRSKACTESLQGPCQEESRAEPTLSSTTLPKRPEELERNKSSAPAAENLSQSRESRTDNPSDTIATSSPVSLASGWDQSTDSSMELLPQHFGPRAKQSAKTVTTREAEPSQPQVLSVTKPISTAAKSSPRSQRVEANQELPTSTTSSKQSGELGKAGQPIVSMAKSVSGTAGSEKGTNRPDSAKGSSRRPRAHSEHGLGSLDTTATSEPLPTGSEDRTRAFATIMTSQPRPKGSFRGITPFDESVVQLPQPKQSEQRLVGPLRLGDYVLQAEEDQGGWQQPNRKLKCKEHSQSSQGAQSSVRITLSGERPSKLDRANPTRAGKPPFSAASSPQKGPPLQQTVLSRKAAPTSTAGAKNAIIHSTQFRTKDVLSSKSGASMNPSAETKSSRDRPEASRTMTSPLPVDMHAEEGPSYVTRKQALSRSAWLKEVGKSPRPNSKGTPRVAVIPSIKTPSELTPTAETTQAYAAARAQEIASTEADAGAQKVACDQEMSSARKAERARELVADLEAIKARQLLVQDTARTSGIVRSQQAQESGRVARPQEGVGCLISTRATASATAHEIARSRTSAALPEECARIVEIIKALASETNVNTARAWGTAQRSIDALETGGRLSVASLLPLDESSLDSQDALEAHNIVSQHSAMHLEHGRALALQCAEAIGWALDREYLKIALGNMAQNVVKDSNLASAQKGGRRDSERSHTQYQVQPSNTHTGQQGSPSRHLNPFAPAFYPAGVRRTGLGVAVFQGGQTPTRLDPLPHAQPLQQGTEGRTRSSRAADGQGRQSSPRSPPPPPKAQSLRVRTSVSQVFTRGAGAQRERQERGDQSKPSQYHVSLVPTRRMPNPGQMEPPPHHMRNDHGAAPGGKTEKLPPSKREENVREDSKQSKARAKQQTPALARPPSPPLPGSITKRRSWANQVEEEEEEAMQGWADSGEQRLPDHSLLPKPTAV